MILYNNNNYNYLINCKLSIEILLKLISYYILYIYKETLFKFPINNIIKIILAFFFYLKFILENKLDLNNIINGSNDLLINNIPLTVNYFIKSFLKKYNYFDLLKEDDKISCIDTLFSFCELMYTSNLTAFKLEFNSKILIESITSTLTY